ncbi:alanine--tRNA ligase-related protein [Lactobacillus taiwanensis]|uniref:alanine--tRNA ligase-related protein n=1 Tax=Lactobacillus taiwanensis TaxID=508451 RepID=UPI003523B840
MKSQYPEVVDQQAFIQKVIKIEEERFQVTLSSGLNLLDNIIAAAIILSSKFKPDERVTWNRSSSILITF